LGRGNAKAVKFSIKVVLYTSICIGFFFFILCLIFGNMLAYLFTSDKEVAKIVTRLSFLLALTIMFNSIQPVFSGAAVGAGMQGIVAIVNLGCYYVIGLPIGVMLAYLADLQVEGIWIGMLLGVVAQTLVLGFLIWRTNWDEQVNKASERLNKWVLKTPDESNRSLVSNK
jgi:MATE family multidrug resistance protein